MGFIRAIGASYANILNFSGRASRAEYWCFVLFQFLVGLALVGATMGYAIYAVTLAEYGIPTPDMIGDLQSWMAIIQVVMFLLLTVPGLSSLIRRLHDTDKSGWWFFISFLPLIGALILLYFVVQPGTARRNRFGQPTVARKHRHKNAPKEFAPHIVAKKAARDAKRRAEIHDYYRKNVAAHAPQT